MITLKDDLNKMNSQYQDYLNEHIGNVHRTWTEILRSAVLELESDINISTIDFTIHRHDKSKRMSDEWDPYLIHFYGNPTEEDEKRFERAWLNHLHRNEHHWQYWVLRHDSGSTEALDMPFEFIMEMLCDWHSFSAKNPESTAYAWYMEHKDNFILSDNTRKVIEKYIEYLKTPLG